MSRAQFYRPFLHGACHGVCNGQIQASAVLNGAFQGLIGIFGKSFLHDFVVKDHTAEIIGYELHNFSPSCVLNPVEMVVKYEKKQRQGVLHLLAPLPSIVLLYFFTRRLSTV
jgi:hypothetical protein